MKAYLNNGITIEGTVAEIKEFLEGQHYTITTTPNTTPVWFILHNLSILNIINLKLLALQQILIIKQYHNGTRRINAICSMTSI